jgi:uncharacterized membrane protein YidH (DUF202 family)
VTRDPLLAPERTVLAWQRFALGLAAIAALALRAGVTHHHEIIGFATAGLLAAAAAVLQLAGPRIEGHRAVRLALGATLAAAAGSLALALG